MRSKFPVGMILQRIAEEGDMNGLSLLVGDMAHLPRAREFASVTDMMARAFRSNRTLGAGGRPDGGRDSRAPGASRRNNGGVE
jgi:hypothetical protein